MAKTMDLVRKFHLDTQHIKLELKQTRQSQRSEVQFILRLVRDRVVKALRKVYNSVSFRISNLLTFSFRI